MQVTFICGCNTGEILTRENLLTMSSVTLDDQGFVVCSVHHQRRRGWRSVPGGFFPLEYEAFILFGERQIGDTSIYDKMPKMVDTRDLRDPVEMGHTIEHKRFAQLKETREMRLSDFYDTYLSGNGGGRALNN